MISPIQLIKYVFEPVVYKLGFDKGKEKNAVALLLYTCAQESNLGKYIHQVGGGPALGIMQMEPATYKDIINNYIVYRPSLGGLISAASGYTGELPTADHLIHNLKFSAAMARVLYRRTPPAIPEYDDLNAMWEIYKTYYNTELGKATFEEFEHKFHDCIQYIENYYA